MYYLTRLSLPARDPNLKDNQPPAPWQSLAHYKKEFLRTYGGRTPSEYSAAQTVLDMAQMMTSELYEQSTGQNKDVLNELGEYGRTILASESLAVLGLKHYIWYGNNRSGVLLPNQDDLTLFVDRANWSPKKERIMPAAIGAALIHGSVEAITSRVNGNPYAVRINAARLTSDGAKQPAGLPWFSTGDAAESSIKMWCEPLRRANQYHAVLNIYEPNLGRGTLRTFSHFQSALKARDPLTALQDLRAMGRAYPHIDPHLPHPEIEQLVAQLCTDGRPHTAIAAVMNYFDNLSGHQDPHLRKMEGRLYAYITKLTTNPEAQALASTKSKQAYAAAQPAPSRWAQPVPAVTVAPSRVSRIHTSYRKRR